jgi:hypothetical protein
MKYLKWLPLVLISSTSCFDLIMSLQPGKLEYFLEEQTLLVLASHLISLLFFLAVAATFLRFKFRKKTSNKDPMLLRQPNNWAMVILLVTTLLMYFHVPVKLAFAFSYSGFQDAISIPSSQREKTIGLYKIETVQRNPSGEVFFPTYNFWAGTVTSWHGFVYKPNFQLLNKSSLRGENRYGAHTYTHMFRDWYLFHGTTC